MKSGFVEASSGKSIPIADWPLVIQNDQKRRPKSCVNLVTKGKQVYLYKATRMQKTLCCLLCGFWALLKYDDDEQKKKGMHLY